MANYSATHQTPAGTTLTILNLISTAAIRPRVYDIIMGSDAAPADTAGEFIVTRTTAVGTGGTGVTTTPLDPLSVASTATATGGTFSGEPTYAAVNLLMLALNQRVTFRWAAFKPGAELVASATASNGIGTRSVAHSATPNINLTVSWEE